MPNYHGKFVWYDLMTTDMKAAEIFYTAVLGWKAENSGMPDRSYTILSVGATEIGGLMPLPPDALAAGGRPVWSGYIAVEDVDAYVEKVRQAGGSIAYGPEHIPGVGRFAIAADPHGARFILFRGTNEAPPAPLAMGTPGSIGWHELHAGNLDGAFAFYSGLFGWTKEMAVDMGPMGLYQTFSTGEAPAAPSGMNAVGGMMAKMPEVPFPFWLYYFTVEDIEAGLARVTEQGGQVLNGPIQVPGGTWIGQCLDPQGAMFALVGPHR